MDNTRDTLRASLTPVGRRGALRRAPALAAAAALCLLLLVLATLQAPTPARAACDAASGCLPVVSQTICSNPSSFVVSNQPCTPNAPPVVVVCPGGAPVTVGGNTVCPSLPGQLPCAANSYVVANNSQSCVTPPTPDTSANSPINSPIVIFRPYGGTVPGSTICIEPGDAIISQSGQSGPVTCGASTAAATAPYYGFAKSAACDGGEAYAAAGAYGNAVAAGCIQAGAAVIGQNTGGAAALAVIPSSIGAPGQQSSSFVLTHGTGVDSGSDNAFAALGTCLTSGYAAIAVSNSVGSTNGTCISINGIVLAPSSYPSTLALALTAANISQSLYNSLIPSCLRPVINAIYLVAIGQYAYVPYASLNSNVAGAICS